MDTSIDNEIDAWAPQMGEHALFLHLLLHDPDLKQRALDLFFKWQDYVHEGTPGGLDTALDMLDELDAFKTEILERLLDGEWLGAVFPQFVEHVRRELRYFRDRISGIEISPVEKVAFWTQIHSEHAGFASHLLDPSEIELVDKADQSMKEIADLPVSNDIASIVMAMEAGVKLTKFNKEALDAVLENQVKSIIHPSLLNHVIREGEIAWNDLSSYVNEAEIELREPSIYDINI